MSGRMMSLAGARPPVNAEPSDEALLAACAEGQSPALGMLFDRHADGVHRFLARLRGADSSDLEDLLQTTFLEVQRSASRFRGHSTGRTWILSIAANVAKLHVRSARRRRGWQAVLAQAPRPAVPSPGELIERRQLVEQIVIALGRLGHDLRVAFVMCDVEEIPAVEVARGLGVPSGTIWRRLHHARKALRAALEACR